MGENKGNLCRGKQRKKVEKQIINNESSERKTGKMIWRRGNVEKRRYKGNAAYGNVVLRKNY